MLQSAWDLNVPCHPKCSKTLFLSYTFKCPLKKTQSFFPCSRALNKSGKGLKCVFTAWEYKDDYGGVPTKILPFLK
jgi:hypothetical protein